ncbi:transcriptional regulator with XRE-family HTH domain [Actinokineospora baliensis]|uniref:helix-turn-helix domain-containing protein n=1 Tax=Actinokineospora baliensis TaxID=547056 RepID=UPI00195DAEE2|nr:helix-turn-helix transcriptional regulator [Actinokineospora baliensis]MBM7774967.1 transcriptional regulator with XRE-family HTH domain [Actinokineospora baliensis]
MTRFPPPESTEDRRRPGRDEETFGAALRAAITRRDLTLDRIRSRLAARGVDISLATLSYWQQGRSRPERPKSLRALRELETILNLRPNALFDLLDPPKPRGRPLTAGKVTGRHLYGEDSPMRRLLGTSFEQFNEGIVVLTMTETCTVDATRSLRRISTTQVLRAVQDDQDRFLYVHGVDEGDVMPSEVRVHSGRLGDVRVDHEAGFLAAEIRFDRALAKNETVVVEYDTVLGESAVPSRAHEHRFRTPVHAFLLRVRFDPTDPPTRCVGFYRPTVPAAAKQRQRLLPDATHTVHTFIPKCAPGVYGMSWRWE